jgi:hypothetical protein
MNKPQAERGQLMELLVVLAVLVLWIVLQAWVLPSLGVKT